MNSKKITAVMNCENAFSEAILTVFKYENSIKMKRALMRTHFSSRVANPEEFNSEIRLANWSIYHKQEDNARYEEALKLNACWRTRKNLKQHCENQCSDLLWAGEKPDWADRYLKKVVKKPTYMLSNRGNPVLNSLQQYASEWIRMEILLKDLGFSTLIRDFKLEDYSIKLSQRFMWAFTNEYVKAELKTEDKKLEKLSFEALTSILEQQFPRQTAQIKLSIRDLEDLKSDILGYTTDILDELDKNISYQKELLAKAEWDEAKELKKQIKKLQDSRSQAQNRWLKRLKDKEKAVKKLLLKTIAEVYEGLDYDIIKEARELLELKPILSVEKEEEPVKKPKENKKKLIKAGNKPSKEEKEEKEQLRIKLLKKQQEIQQLKSRIRSW